MHKIRMWDKLQVPRDNTEATRERLDGDDAAAKTEAMDTRPNLAAQPAATLEAGQEALSRAAWEEARTHFEAALEREETPEALEGLSWAAWWLSDAAVTLNSRERAYRLYQARGDRREAARMAIWIAHDYIHFRVEPAIANGWRQRARRLLRGWIPYPEMAGSR